MLFHFSEKKNRKNYNGNSFFKLSSSMIIFKSTLKANLMSCIKNKTIFI